MVEEGANDALDEFDTSVIEERAGVRSGHQMRLGDVLDPVMMVGIELGISGIDVGILDEERFNVSVHSEADLAPGHVC